MSLSYDEIAKLKRGDVIYEVVSYIDIPVRLIDDPFFSVVNMPDGSKFEQIVFTGETIQGDEVVDIDFRITKGQEHYGPKLYCERGAYQAREDALQALADADQEYDLI